MGEVQIAVFLSVRRFSHQKVKADLKSNIDHVTNTRLMLHLSAILTIINLFGIWQTYTRKIWLALFLSTIQHRWSYMLHDQTHVWFVYEHIICWKLCEECVDCHLKQVKRISTCTQYIVRMCRLFIQTSSCSNFSCIGSIYYQRNDF